MMVLNSIEVFPMNKILNSNKKAPGKEPCEINKPD